MLIVRHDPKKIFALKKALSKSFFIKDLGSAKQIPGLKITRDQSKRLLWPFQERYFEKLLERFNMRKAKSVNMPLAAHFKLSTKQSPTSEKEKAEMTNVPYSSAVGSLMYAMICTRPDITYTVGVVIWFLTNPLKENWLAVK